MNKGLRLGVMGGSFDPIHYGHLSLASQAACSFRLDRVAFVPTNFSAGKRPVASPLERCAMTAMATGKDPKFFVSKVDVNRKGATFAFDTLSDLASIYGPCELFFILGSDAFLGMEKWKNWERLFSMSRFIVAPRPGFPLGALPKTAGKVEVLPSPLLPISSSGLRERVAAGRPIDFLTDPNVCSFIRARGLYRREKCPRS